MLLWLSQFEAPESALALWVKAVRQFKFMISILKKVNARAVLVAAMQQGDIFLRIFIQNCMSLLDRTFSESFDDVKRLLSAVQNATRQLQTLCIHSKAIENIFRFKKFQKMSKDKSLTKYVPPLKKTLEELLYRVKAMMAINKCEKAIKISDLKLRNLQGEELLSQNFYYATAQSDDEESDVDESVSKDAEIAKDTEKDDDEENESEPQENEEEDREYETNDDITESPIQRTQMSDAF
uniref:Uncharacterized protein n=1 Tax=Romanomermis culicivorax TaxID=13658 RepID=A0A915JW07_ROMCU